MKTSLRQFYSLLLLFVGIFALALFLMPPIKDARAQSSWQTTQLTAHLIAASSPANGGTPSDARALIVSVSTDFTGTIDGQPILPTAPRTMVWNPVGEHTIKSMPYNVTAGSIYIQYLK